MTLTKLGAITAARDDGHDAHQRLRTAVLDAVNEKISIAKIAAAAGVSRNTIYQWQKKASK